MVWQILAYTYYLCYNEKMAIIQRETDAATPAILPWTEATIASTSVDWPAFAAYEGKVLASPDSRVFAHEVAASNFASQGNIEVADILREQVRELLAQLPDVLAIIEDITALQRQIAASKNPGTTQFLEAELVSLQDKYLTHIRYDPYNNGTGTTPYERRHIKSGAITPPRLEPN